jgi:putative oxidoreductase
MSLLMLKDAQRDLVRDKGTILGRALIGLLFFGGGVSMLFMQTPSGVATFFDEGLNLPMPVLLAWLVIIVKIVAGGAIILGQRVGLAAAVLIGFTVLATLIAHMGDMTAILKNLAIIGGLLYLMAYGPGGSNTEKLATKTE